MAYNPGVSDQSGQILAQAIGNIAQQYGQSQEKMRLTDAELAHLKSTVDFASQKGVLSPEELQRFASGNLNKKREIASLAGMKYKDWQDQQDRATISPEMAAELKASGYLAAPMGGGRFQYLQTPGEAPQQSPEVTAMLAQQGYIPVNTGRGRVDFLPPAKQQSEAFQFDPTRDVVPIPGTGSMFVRTSPTGGGNVMPGAEQSSSFDAATAPRVTVGGREGIVVPDGRGGVKVQFPPGAASGTVAKPMDAVAAQAFGNLTSRIGEIDNELAMHVMEISKGDNRYGFLNNSSRESRVKELQTQRAGLQAQLTAMRPVETPRAPQQAAPVRAAAPKATPRAATPAKASKPRNYVEKAVDEALNTDALPAEAGGADTGAGVLPPLPNVDEPVDVATPEEAKKLPPGTKFRTPDGRVILKK